VLSLSGFALTVFFIFKPKYGSKVAFWNALSLVTCGRILFWDALLGLIDIFFSWVMFGMFMVVYHAFREGNFKKLFIGAYLLAAIGFLLKGLPALVFLGCTLGAWFLFKRALPRLFSGWHFAGLGLFILIVGGYYLIYHQYNDLSRVIPVLLDESLKRTGVRFGWTETILHILSFPLEMVYHFLPWSLLIVLFFWKGSFKRIFRDEFITFNLVVFAANIVVYWLSPEVYPRYLFMLLPLLFSSFFFLYEGHAAQKTSIFKFLTLVLSMVLPLVILASMAPAFLERTREIPFVYLKSGLLFAGSLGLTLAFWKIPENRLLVLITALLWMRLGFNWFVLPDRLAEDWGTLCRATSIDAGTRFKGNPLYIYRETDFQMTNAFYMTNARQQIIRRVDVPVSDTTARYIINPEKHPELSIRKVGEFKYRHGKGVLVIGALSSNPPKK